MEPVIKRGRARVRGRHLELLEDVDLAADREVTVGIKMPSEVQPGIVDAMRASAGAWSAEVHLELKTREDAVHGLTLVTYTVADFKKVPGLVVETAP
jgi:hypothetical protein